MERNNRLDALSYDIRRAIWEYAYDSPATPKTTQCCNCLHIVTPSKTDIDDHSPCDARKQTVKKCLRTSVDIADEIDPLSLTRRDEDMLKQQSNTLVFCAKACLRSAFRLPTSYYQQLANFGGRTVMRVKIHPRDLEWVSSACEEDMDAASTFMSFNAPLLITQHTWQDKKAKQAGQAQGEEGAKLHGDERVDAIKERMFGELTAFARKYLNVKVGFLSFEWCGKEGGSGWAQLSICASMPVAH